MPRASMLSEVLRRRFDPALEAVMRRMSRHDVRGPLRAALAPHRGRAMRRTIDRFGPAIAPLEGAVLRGEPAAIERFDALVAEAVTTMRAERPSDLDEDGRAPLTELLHAVDARLYRDRPELMDDPSLPEDERTHALDVLDRFNHCTGIYETVMAAIDPLVEAASGEGKRPIVHDVAAGHGGLALHLAERLGDRVTIEASDLREEYLALGRTQAAERGLSVRFSVEDALALGGLSERGVDVITCTQAIHHFPPGMIARMMSEAARRARVGACFIDGERSFTTLGLVALVGALYGRTYTFYYDAVTSIRRMFYEEELALVAALAPGMPKVRVETGIAPPSHVYVRITREP
ncbi:class I SAM-dependent methyltransferase [Polyangium mundeleinium]|uniref:Methyltransferase domain-containing protein n=1 Tax=Polyangium mundeleinium TaxID=2995306 RepID=A0ABT5F6Z9_9BACT|nr:methyltransferase domain-containing protein [Polyangium mundeleinium]MDC0749886.1 methyltransferase domain-containing protein [Polyangium mundeleinium]